MLQKCEGLLCTWMPGVTADEQIPRWGKVISDAGIKME